MSRVPPYGWEGGWCVKGEDGVLQNTVLGKLNGSLALQPGHDYGISVYLYMYLIWLPEYLCHVQVVM